MGEMFGPVGQIGYVVYNLESAARQWAETTGIGPWHVLPRVPLDHFTYYGAESGAEIGIAMAYSGDVQIELIQQHNDAPSMYRDLLDTYGEGVQHVCFYPADYDAAMTAAADCGMEVGQHGALWGIRFAYLRGESGRVIELADLPDAVRDRRGDAVAEAAAWDGSDPVRIRV
jgi:catechol 2,3-dioxygenase-like lactoylglutathione lyase family enzyme